MRRRADRRHPDALGLVHAAKKLSSAAQSDLVRSECKWFPAFLHTGSPNNKQMWRAERGTPAATVCVCSFEAPAVCQLSWPSSPQHRSRQTALRCKVPPSSLPFLFFYFHNVFIRGSMFLRCVWGFFLYINS